MKIKSIKVKYDIGETVIVPYGYDTYEEGKIIKITCDKQNIKYDIETDSKRILIDILELNLEEIQVEM